MRRSALLFACIASACAAAPPAPGPSQPKPVPAAAPAAGLPPLSERERVIADELRSDVAQLAGKIGERNADKKWELASAADWLVESLEKIGYAVARDGHEIDGVLVQNLSVQIRGGSAADEVVVVGAHYDSATGSPGANDNASGVAALLALARRYQTASADRTLRFVFFANEEPPYFQTPKMGSLLYARGLVVRRENVVAMLSLESIGVYSDAAGSPTRAPSPRGKDPDHRQLRRRRRQHGVEALGRSRGRGALGARQLARRRRGSARRRARGRLVRPLVVLADRRACGDDHGHGAVS